MHVYARITVSGHDVAVTSIEARSTWVPRGQPVYISVTVENQGEVAETFDVIVYADRNSGDLHYDIGNETVSLDPQESTLLEFVWDTTEVPCGTYDITAEAILPEDADPADNIVRTKIGGICVPYNPPSLDIFGMLISIASAVLVMILLGAVALGFFKVLMSPKMWKMRAI
ncbi:MAG: hypothetical protein ACETV1_01385 [Candidatus Bathyarchaeia archaeon]